MNLCQHLSNELMFDGMGWDGKHEMLRLIAQNYQNFLFKGENNKTVEDLISGIEENLLKELISLLKPFD